MRTPFGPSELIITPKGTIYHLDLAPEQLAPTVITVGDPARVGEVSKYFDRIEHRTNYREFITHTGFIGKKRISVVSTGIGPDNIDIVLNELDALVNIDFKTRLPMENPTPLTIIRMGTCGALQPHVPVDSMVVSTHGIGLDNLLHYYHQQPFTAEESQILEDFRQQTNLPRSMAPYIAKGVSRLTALFKKDYLQGITVTCPGFYGPQGRALRADLAFPLLVPSLTSFKSGEHQIMNFEMETSAIYGLGKILGHQCLSINTVVANRVLKTFSANPASAVNRMIAHSLEILNCL